MIDRLAELETRFEDVSRQMATPDVASNPSQLAELGRELARLEPIVTALREYRNVRDELEGARAMADDPDAEMRAMAHDEVTRLEGRETALEAELRLALVARDPNDERNVIVEIRAGAGGEEASLFAADLYRMYARYAERRRWKVEVLSTSESEEGGFKEIVFEVRGDGAYSRLKFESGVHRVQRVPVTEASGPHPHLHGDRRGPARGRRGRDPGRREGPPDRCLPLQRPRWPEREHDRLGGAHHAPADRPRCRDPGREERSSRTGLRRCPCSVPGCSRWSRSGRLPSAAMNDARRSAPVSGARRSAPTTSRRPGDRPSHRPHASTTCRAAPGGPGPRDRSARRGRPGRTAGRDRRRWGSLSR